MEKFTASEGGRIVVTFPGHYPMAYQLVGEPPYLTGKLTQGSPEYYQVLARSGDLDEPLDLSSVVGVYDVNGVDPNGKAYSSAVSFKLRRDDSYQIDGTVAGRRRGGVGTWYHGRIMMNGDEFPVFYTLNADGQLKKKV
jgi:hypothetical protein